MTDAATIFYGLKGKTITFETASGKGISSADLSAGDQVSNDPDAGDVFRLHQVDEDTYKFESVATGLFIGLSPEPCCCPCGYVLKTVMVDGDDESANLSALPAKDESEDSVSFSPASNPDFFLSSHEDKLWFFSGPLCEKDDFAAASSFKVAPVVGQAERFVDGYTEAKSVLLNLEKGSGLAVEGSDIVAGAPALFRLVKVQPFVYKLESVEQEGSFVGLGEEGAVVLVEDGPDAHLHAAPARNETEGFTSFEPISKPGFSLCLMDGKMCFSEGATENASFKLDGPLARQKYILDCLEGMDTQFRSINGRGISTLDDDGNPFKFWDDGDADLGEQLYDSVDEDHWRVWKVQGDDMVYKFESVTTSGTFIGVGKRSEVEDSFGYKSILQKGNQPGTQFKLVPPVSDEGEGSLMSFESVHKPGYILNHSAGRIWLLEGATIDSLVADSTWSVTFNG